MDKLASRLNEATENLNERLSEIEERFRQTKLGLEVWLEEDDDLIPADPLHAPDGTWDEERRISLPPDSEAYHRAFESYFTVGMGQARRFVAFPVVVARTRSTSSSPRMNGGRSAPLSRSETRPNMCASRPFR